MSKKSKTPKASLQFAHQLSAPAILDLLAQQKFDDAFKLANRLLAKRPEDPDIMLLAGVAAAQSGRVGEAAQQWQRMIALAQADKVPLPILTQVWFNLGKLCQDNEQPQDAEQCYRQALEADSANKEAREQLALLLAAQGRSDDAIAFFRSLAESDTPQSRFHFNLAVLLAGQGVRVEAIAQYRQALALDGDYAEAWTNLGLMLMEDGLLDEALDCQERACAVAPDSAIAHSNRGLVLDELRRVPEAEEAMRVAVQLAPDSARGLSNLAVLSVAQGNYIAGENLFRKALSIDPEYLTAALFLSNLLLAEGRFVEGWDLYEVRYHPNMTERQTILPPVDYPQWRGESLQGKTLMVWPEQGFGDEIQFCRYIAEVKALGARKVSLVCRDALVPAMEGVAGLDRIIPVTSLKDGIPQHDYWTFSMSIPRFFVGKIPATLPYMHAPANRIARWADLLKDIPKQNLKVGLLWKGNPKHLNDLDRSLPSLEALAPLWGVSHVTFISLQQDAAHNEQAALPILQLGQEIADFGDAAALIAQLDLVISVDSAYAHLAGALGKPCWVLLPKRRTDWRWLHGREDSPWYPGVMRVFKQHERGDWKPVIEQIALELVRVSASNGRFA